MSQIGELGPAGLVKIRRAKGIAEFASGGRILFKPCREAAFRGLTLDAVFLDGIDPGFRDLIRPSLYGSGVIYAC